MSVTMALEDDIDISRGNMIVRENNQPQPVQDVDVMICWLNENKPVLGVKYILKHTSNEVRTMIKDIAYTIDINTLHRMEDKKDIQNE